MYILIKYAAKMVKIKKKVQNILLNCVYLSIYKYLLSIYMYVVYISFFWNLQVFKSEDIYLYIYYNFQYILFCLLVREYICMFVCMGYIYFNGGEMEFVEVWAVCVQCYLPVIHTRTLDHNWNTRTATIRNQKDSYRGGHSREIALQHHRIIFKKVLNLDGKVVWCYLHILNTIYMLKNISIYILKKSPFLVTNRVCCNTPSHLWCSGNIVAFQAVVRN